MKRYLLLLFVLTTFLLVPLGLLGETLNENFDGDWVGSPAAPDGWKVVNVDGDSYKWSRANTYITPTHSPLYAAHGMGNDNDYLITPALSVSNGDQLAWWDRVESSSRNNSYKVMVSTTDSEVASFTTELGDFDCTNTSWTEHTLDLSAYAGQVIYVAFYQYYSAATNYGFGIDDVTGPEIYVAPYGIAFTAPSDASVAAGASYTYEIAIENTGANNDTYNLAAANGSWTYQILEHGTSNVISSITVASGATATVDFQVTVPAAGINNGDTDAVTFTATSQGDETITDNATLTTTAVVPVSLPFADDFESGTTGFELASGDYADARVDVAAANVGSYGLLFEGGNTSTGWTGGSTSATATNAWVDNVSHQSSSEIMVDATNNSVVEMTFDLRQTYSYGAKYSWFRVLVNGTPISDVEGTTDFNPTSSSDPFTMKTFNLSAYAGTIFTLTFQASGKYNAAYSSPGDNSFVDNVRIKEPAPNDMAANAVLDIDATFLTTATPFTVPVEIENKGTANQTGFSSTLFVNGEEVQTLTGLSLNTGLKDTLNFTWTPQLVGEFALKAVVSLAGDSDASNDETIERTFQVYPDGVLLLEGFEDSWSGNTPANGWTQTSPTSKYFSQVTTGSLYDASASSVSPHGGNYFVKYDCWGYQSGNYANLISPAFDLTSANNPRVIFWMYRDDGYNGTQDRMHIFVNTTADTVGATYLGTINRSVTLSPAESGGCGWYKYTFNLPPEYNGATNHVIFQGYSEYGPNLYLDDVYVGPPTTNYDMELSSIALPAGIGINQTNEITIHYANQGLQDMTFDLHFLPQDGSEQMETITLASGQVGNHTFNWIPQQQGIDSLHVWIESAQDEVLGNNQGDAWAFKGRQGTVLSSSFEGDFPPNGWAIGGGSYSSYWTQGSYATPSDVLGRSCAVTQGTGNELILETSIFDVSEVANPQLNFTWQNTGTSNGKVYISGDGGVNYDEFFVLTANTTQTTSILPIPDTYRNAANMRLKFAITPSTNNALALDNVFISLPPEYDYAIQAIILPPACAVNTAAKFQVELANHGIRQPYGYGNGYTFKLYADQAALDAGTALYETSAAHNVVAGTAVTDVVTVPAGTFTAETNTLIAVAEAVMNSNFDDPVIANNTLGYTGIQVQPEGILLTEDFATQPNNWTFGNDWSISSSAAYLASGNANGDTLALPVLDLTLNDGDDKLTYEYKGGADVQLLASTDGETWTVLANHNGLGAPTIYTENIIDLAPYAEATNLQLMFVANALTNSFYVDNVSVMPKDAHDLGIAGIQEENFYVGSQTAQMKVLVANNGQNAMNGVPLNFWVKQGADTVFTATENVSLMPSTQLEVVFDGYSPEEAGTYLLNAALVVTDSVVANNQLSKTLSNVPYAIDVELNALSLKPAPNAIGDTVTVEFAVENEGALAQTVALNYQLFDVNGLVLKNVTESLELASGETVDYTFTESIILTAYGEFNVIGTLTLAENQAQVVEQSESFIIEQVVEGNGEVASADYNWIELKDDPEALVISPIDDGNYDNIALGFDFEFYGIMYDAIATINNNGILFFADNSDGANGNQSIPSAGFNKPFIAPLWDDLNTNGGSARIYHKQVESDKYVVEYYGLSKFGNSKGDFGEFTFEVVFDGSDNSVTMLYHTIDKTGVTTLSSTVGIQNNGTQGLQYYYSGEGTEPTSETAIRFTTPTFPPLAYNARMQSVRLNTNQYWATQSYPVEAVVVNSGQNDLANIQVEIQMDGETIATETIAALGIGESETISVDYTVPLPEGETHTVSAALICAQDMDYNDNGASSSFTAVRNGLLLSEDFVSPAGWYAGGDWNASYSASITAANANGDTLLTPVINLSQVALATLEMDVKLVKGANSVKVYGVTNDTWTMIRHFTAEDSLPAYTREMLSLADFATAEDFQVAWIADSLSQTFYLDNVYVGLPRQKDMAVEEIQLPEGFIFEGTTVAIKVKAHNYGQQTLNGTVTLEVTDNQDEVVYSFAKYTGNLDYNEDALLVYNVALPDADGNVTYTAKATIEANGDEVFANNEIETDIDALYLREPIVLGQDLVAEYGSDTKLYYPLTVDAGTYYFGATEPGWYQPGVTIYADTMLVKISKSSSTSGLAKLVITETHNLVVEIEKQSKTYMTFFAGAVEDFTVLNIAADDTTTYNGHFHAPMADSTNLADYFVLTGATQPYVVNYPNTMSVWYELTDEEMQTVAGGNFVKGGMSKATGANWSWSYQPTGADDMIFVMMTPTASSASGDYVLNVTPARYLSMATTPEAAWNATQDTLDFASLTADHMVEVGNQVEASIAFFNTGLDTITVTNFTTADTVIFTSFEEAVKIPPQQSSLFHIYFKPITDGVVEETIIFNTVPAQANPYSNGIKVRGEGRFGYPVVANPMGTMMVSEDEITTENKLDLPFLDQVFGDLRTGNFAFGMLPADEHVHIALYDVTYENQFPRINSIDADWNAPEGVDLVFFATNGANATTYDTLTLVVTPVNDAPENSAQIEDALADTLYANTGIQGNLDLDAFFNDIDDTTLYYSVATQVLENGYVTIEDNYLRINTDMIPDASFDENRLFTDSVTVVCQDGMEIAPVLSVNRTNTPQLAMRPISRKTMTMSRENVEGIGTVSQSFEIIILAQPIYQIPTITLAEDVSQNYLLEDWVKNIDDTTLVWTITSSDTNMVKVLENDTTLTLLPQLNQNGEAMLNILVAFDPNPNSDIVSLQATQAVTITPVNDAPMMITDSTQVPDVEFAEDTQSEWIQLVDYFTDVDLADAMPDTLHLEVAHMSMRENSSHLVPVLEQSRVSFTAEADWNGSEEWLIKAVDLMGCEVVDTITITVTPVNDAPRVVAQIPDQFILGNMDTLTVAQIDEIFEDVDDPCANLTLSLVFDTLHLAVQANGHELTLKPLLNEDFVGDVTVTLTDTFDLSGSQTFTVEVNGVTVNDSITVGDEDIAPADSTGEASTQLNGMAAGTYYFAALQSNLATPSVIVYQNGIAVDTLEAEPGIAGLRTLTLPEGGDYTFVMNKAPGSPDTVEMGLAINELENFTSLQMDNPMSDALNYTIGSASDLNDFFRIQFMGAKIEFFLDDNNVDAQAMLYVVHNDELALLKPTPLTGGSWILDPNQFPELTEGDWILIMMTGEPMAMKNGDEHDTEGAYTFEAKSVKTDPKFVVLYDGTDITDDEEFVLDYEFGMNKQAQIELKLQNSGEGMMGYYVSLRESQVAGGADLLIDEIDVPWNKAWGMAFKDGYLYNTNVVATGGQGVIYKINPETKVSEEFLRLQSISSPSGITWVGNRLFVSDWRSNAIYEINTEFGTAIDTIVTGGTEPGGLTYDGQFIWNLDYSGRTIYQIDKNTGDVVANISLPETIEDNCEGLAYVKEGALEYFWTNDGNLLYKIEFDRDDNGLITAIDTDYETVNYDQGEYNTGLAWDGLFLWNAHKTLNKIFKLDVNGVSFNDEISWLHLDSNQNGNVSGIEGETVYSDTVRLSIDVSEEMVGTQQAYIYLKSNDPLKSVKEIPVAITVYHLDPEMVVEPSGEDTLHIMVPYLGQANGQFFIHNDGHNFLPNYEITQEDAELPWLTVAPMSGTDLMAGDSAEVVVTVNAATLSENQTYATRLQVVGNGVFDYAGEAFDAIYEATTYVNVQIHVGEMAPILAPLPEMMAMSAEQITIPVTIQNLYNLGVDKEIFSYEFVLDYDQTKLAWTGMDTDETLCEGWTIQHNLTANGLSVAALCMDGIQYTGDFDGTLLNLHFTVTGINNDSTALAYTHFMLNEGDPDAVVTDGYVKVEDHYLRGDANLNAAVSAGDASAVLCHATLAAPLAGTALVNADASGAWLNDETPDSSVILAPAVNAYDAYYILSYVTSHEWPSVVRSGDNAEFTLNSKTIPPNSYFTVPVYLDGDEVNAGNFILEYDSEFLELKSAEVALENDLVNVNTNEEGKIGFAFVSLDGVSDGVVVNLHFYAKVKTGQAAMRLANIDINASTKADKEMMITVGVPIAQEVLLSQNYPNPFNPDTKIDFNIPAAGHVSLRIYNVAGQLVKVLANDQYAAGRHTLIWNGTNENNESVASGVYFYRLESGEIKLMKKMILMK